jgi:hypothetical protein
MEHECLICYKKFTTKKSLSGHVRNHDMTISEYKEKFGLYKRCKKCNKKVSKKCTGEYCNRCRDRTGINNSFFGKKHSTQTIEVIKEKVSLASKKLWEDEEYRKKVIKGVSKPRRKGFAEEQSKRVTKWYEENPSQRDLRSEIMKQSWKDGKITSNNFSCNSSKIENDFFNEIEKIYPNIRKKVTLRDSNNRVIYPDILVDDHLIIEFFGDFWHANPKFYSPDDIIIKNITAKEIWEHDKERIDRLSHVIQEDSDFATEYRVEIVWEDDYKNDKDNVLKYFDMILNWESCTF